MNHGSDKSAPVTIIGGGLAGCEAAWRLGKAEVPARLYEMRPGRQTPAHRTGLLAELVCSNSLKSTSPANAAGLLKMEMEAMGSLVMRAAKENAVPAGLALAVDRDGFASYITEAVESLPGIEVIREELVELPDEGAVIIASGPLTSDPLAESIRALTGDDGLSFHDAIAPIIHADSVDMGVAFKASRYDKGDADYINCPMGRDGYESFVDALVSARRAPFRDFEDPSYFEGCLPIEVMAERGRDTLAHGPLKPVGLVDPRDGKRPHAVVQLRQDDAEGSLYNMVGFQTRLAYPEQERVFRTIPGLENAEFARLGGVHRNSFINSPKLLDGFLRLKSDPRIIFAGQLTGVEGYLASAVTGLIAGINAARIHKGLDPMRPGTKTMTGALIEYVTEPSREDFQPIGPNFGVLAPLSMRGKKIERREAMARRAAAEIENFIRQVTP